MKQVKYKGDVWNVLDEGSAFYVLERTKKQSHHERGFAQKNQCKPVESERWVDVTGECDVEDSVITHDGYCRFDGFFISRGYRLRRIHDPLGIMPSRIIIEKRESDERSQKKESL